MSSARDNSVMKCPPLGGPPFRIPAPSVTNTLNGQFCPATQYLRFPSQFSRGAAEQRPLLGINFIGFPKKAGFFDRAGRKFRLVFGGKDCRFCPLEIIIWGPSFYFCSGESGERPSEYQFMNISMGFSPPELFLGCLFLNAKIFLFTTT